MKYIFLLIPIIAFAGINVIPDKDAEGNIINKQDPFASKSNYNFRGNGAECNLAASPATTNCDFAVPMASAKFNGIHIINSAIGDKANLKIVDTAAGTYSTVPNFVLNQFGFNWNLTSPSVKEILPYPAELFQGMIIRAEITNSGAAKTVYINYYLHEQI